MEKRKSSRLPITLDVEHILGDSESCICLGRDISLGGIQLSAAPRAIVRCVWETDKASGEAAELLMEQRERQKGRKPGKVPANGIGSPNSITTMADRTLAH